MPSDRRFPSRLTIRPLDRPPRISIVVPGSKSLTNRALLLAALRTKPGESCRLENALRSEDTVVMIESLRRLGWTVNEEGNDTLVVRRPSSTRIIPATVADLDVANSGTSMRFLTAAVSLGEGRYRLDGNKRMRQRPIQDLVDALKALGVHIDSASNNGCPPVVVEANGWHTGHVTIRGDVSSQFLSAILLAAPSSGRDVVIELEGSLVSEPYVEMTVEMVRQFGGIIDRPTPAQFRVFPQSSSAPTRYVIEPDASAASYFFAAAAITGGSVTVAGLSRRSLQGDVAFIDVLSAMGCRVDECDAGITVHGRPLRGVDVDMNAISDTVMTLAAVACFADGPTTIRNVAHIRYKETDRITALATELRKLGVVVEESTDRLTLIPAPLRGGSIETYDDHRMAMSLALVGLRVPDVEITNPGCVSKTYPAFWDDLERLRER